MVLLTWAGLSPFEEAGVERPAVADVAAPEVHFDAEVMRRAELPGLDAEVEAC